MESLNIHIYPTTFKFESRILKETQSIVKLGLAAKVLILSSWEKGQPKKEFINNFITVYRIKSFLWWLPKSKILTALFYLEFYLKAIFLSLTIRIDIITCHSLMVLPLSVILKKIKKAKLIYDPHELETERVGLKGIAQRVSKCVEKKLIYSADAIIVVGDSIKNWYCSAYQLNNVYTIKNIPHHAEIPSSNILREQFSLSSSHQIFLYQGLLSKGRSIELYLNAFTKARPDQHLVIMGYGNLEGLVNEYAAKYSNIHFHEAVKPHALLAYTCSADVGLTLIDNICLSYYYSLPNKFFEYIIAGIPLIASDFPDMANIVRQYNIGWAVEVTEKSLINLLNTLTPFDLKAKKESLKMVRDLFSWEKQEPILTEVFRQLYEHDSKR